MKLNGEPRYIATTAYFDDMCNITLGDRVVISTDVSFLTHDYSITIALRSIGEEPPTDIAMVRGITVGDNVFIGRSCLVMPNTTIGNHVIVAAGSVVRGRIPDYSIVMGNPAAVVGHIRDKARKWQDLDKAQMRQD
jgi:acetyltransferase-like isoleucine patch superfamily enzyme